MGLFNHLVTSEHQPAVVCIPLKQLVNQVTVAEYREQYQYLFKIVHTDVLHCLTLEDHFHNAKRALDVTQELSAMRCTGAGADDQENVCRVHELSARYFEIVIEMFKAHQSAYFNNYLK